MVGHQLDLVIELVRKVEKESVLQSTGRSSEPRSCFERTVVRFLVMPKVEETTCFIEVPHGLRLRVADELIEIARGLLVVPEVK